MITPLMGRRLGMPPQGWLDRRRQCHMRTEDGSRCLKQPKGLRDSLGQAPSQGCGVEWTT